MANKWETQVWLEPIEHKYYHKETNEVFKSVTTILSLLEPHFDSDSVAYAISQQSDDVKKPEYVGMTKDEILTEWERINREANEYGTEVHEILERYLLADRIYIPKNDYEREIISKFQEVDDMSGTVYPEAVLFSEKYKICGTADIVEDCGEYFNILDFKTNKELNYISKYNQWLNKPVSHLSDCQYNVYALQLSIYAYMIQMQTRKKVGKLQIFYLNPQKDYTFEKINMPYLGRDAKAVLDHWLEIQKNPQ